MTVCFLGAQAPFSLLLAKVHRFLGEKMSNSMTSNHVPELELEPRMKTEVDGFDFLGIAIAFGLMYLFMAML